MASNPLDQLIRRGSPKPATSPHFWATVVDDSPLTILPDKSPDAPENRMEGPSNIAPGLVISDRVFCVTVGTSVVVLGKSQ